MTNRERENLTLSFSKPGDRGSVEETFFPWTMTVRKFVNEGLPAEIGRGVTDIVNDSSTGHGKLERYFSVAWGEGVMKYEKHLGFDPVRRIGFTLPFRVFNEKILEDTPQYTIKACTNGRIMKYYKNDRPAEIYREIVTCDRDWENLKAYGNTVLEKHYTDENIENAYGPLKEDHRKGRYPTRMNIEGFFWTPRELLGIEPHMYAFFDMPELIHDMNEYILEVYVEKLEKILSIIPVDVIYIMEDLSGKNGPMLSPGLFDEFVGSYYKRLIPVLKDCGARHVFVDTDGDFKKLIPNFIKAGVEGFLPMDVNAGMDIVAVRNEFPQLKFIGGFNKLCIAQGRDAIDREFERVMPVIRQGGYIPGTDHQVPPSASLENYMYYIEKLKAAMREAGTKL